MVRNFIAETEKLIDLGLWEETKYQVAHRFGDTRFLSYSRPKQGVKFYLGGKRWKIIGRRSLKEGQYAKELYDDKDGFIRYVDIPLSRYEPY